MPDPSHDARYTDDTACEDATARASTNGNTQTGAISAGPPGYIQVHPFFWHGTDHHGWNVLSGFKPIEMGDVLKYGSAPTTSTVFIKFKDSLYASATRENFLRQLSAENSTAISRHPHGTTASFLFKEYVSNLATKLMDEIETDPRSRHWSWMPESTGRQIQPLEIRHRGMKEAERRAREAEAQRVFQAESHAAAERDAEAERISQADRDAEAERFPQAQPDVQAKNDAESEHDAKTKPVAESKHDGEAELIGQSDDDAQAE